MNISRKKLDMRKKSSKKTKYLNRSIKPIYNIVMSLLKRHQIFIHH